MEKFEYKTYSFKQLEVHNEIGEKDIQEINKLGEKGWELISVVPVKMWRQMDDPEYLLTAFLKRIK